MATSTARSLGLPLVVTVVAVTLAFLASTWGVASFSQSRAATGGAAALPATLESAPASVGTTGQYGPPGPVSLVYPGTRVESGLVGEVPQPWLTVAAAGGGYRAVDAPDLPSARTGRVALDATGEQLAWATGDGVEVYDTTTGEDRLLRLPGAEAVGGFSPDGSSLSVYAEGVTLLDLASGEQLAHAAPGSEGPDPSVVTRAAWRADGSALDWADGDSLVSLSADGSEPPTAPSPFAPDAPLAWAPTGDRLVSLQEDADGNLRLFAAPADSEGGLGAAKPVASPGVAVQSMLGFSGNSTVAVIAYQQRSGDLEVIVDIPLDGGSAASVTSLPRPGVNWRDSGRLVAAADALRAGSSDFGGQTWPWSYRARQVACTLAGAFCLGLWLTRRRRRRKQRGSRTAHR